MQSLLTSTGAILNPQAAHFGAYILQQTILRPVIRLFHTSEID